MRFLVDTGVVSRVREGSQEMPEAGRVKCAVSTVSDDRPQAETWHEEALHRVCMRLENDGRK